MKWYVGRANRLRGLVARSRTITAPKIALALVTHPSNGTPLQWWDQPPSLAICKLWKFSVKTIPVVTKIEWNSRGTCSKKTVPAHSKWINRLKVVTTLEEHKKRH